MTYDNIWIDDISFVRSNDCKDPTALTNDRIGSTDAILSWTGGDSLFVVQVSTDPYFADPSALVFNDTVDSNPCRVTGLEALNTYVWRVKAICGGGKGESEFSTKSTFTTSRSPYFLEEFTTAVSSDEWLFSTNHAENILDASTAITSGSSTWGFGHTETNYGLQGPHYMAAGYSSDYHWMVTPNFYLPEDDSVHFSMNVALTACNTSHKATSAAASESDMKDDYYFMIVISDDGGQTWKSENILGHWQNTNPEGKQLRDIPNTGMLVRYSLAPYAGKNIRIGIYREAKTSSTTGIAIHVDNVRLAYFHKIIDYASGCQYEDIQVGDIYLSGDDTEPGIHMYPTCEYVSDAQAKAGVRDTVNSLEIEVFEVSEFAFSDTICEGQVYTDENFHDKDHSGIYRRKGVSSHGCDSIITLYLTVIPSVYAEDLQVAICPGETYMWNDKPYNRAGIYRDTTVSSLGCDSIGTLIIAYAPSEDTIRDASRVELEDLPFTYQNETYPYVEGQLPIFYDVDTEKGIYMDTVLVQGENCAVVLVHTLEIYDRHEAIDIIDALDRGARKVLFREHMYIILNEEWYNAAGQRVADPRK